MAAAESLGMGNGWRDLFVKCDTDYSGELSPGEILKAVRVNLRIPTTVLTDKQVMVFVR